MHIGTRAGSHMPHPTLIGGPEPVVLGAGEIDIRAGQIYSINNLSGHFQPSPNSLGAMYEAFSGLPSTAFSFTSKCFAAALSKKYFGATERLTESPRWPRAPIRATSASPAHLGTPPVPPGGAARGLLPGGAPYGRRSVSH